MLVNDDKFDLIVDFHTEADLGEGCVPIGRKLGFCCVQPSLPSCKVEVAGVCPEFGMEMEG